MAVKSNKDEFYHNLRNALVGLYYERKCLLKHMLTVAEAVESKGAVPKKLIDKELRGMMSCINKLDTHLKRLNDTAYPKKEVKGQCQGD